MLQGKKVLQDIRNKINFAANKMAEIEEERLKETVAHEGDGQPSLPGEPPNEQSGDLHDGIEVKVQGIDMRFISNSEHSEFVEYGTYRMAPRPFMRPFINKLKRRFVPDMVKTLKSLR